MKQKSIYYEAIFTLLTLGYVIMNRANEASQSVQRRIQIAIGDVSTYTGGYSDGSSMAGASLNSSGSGGGSGSTSSMDGSGSMGGGSGNSSGNNSGSSASRLFKKSSKSSKGTGNTIGEFTDYLTDEDLAWIDHQLTLAADLYCRAAGVFEYVTQQMIPRWNQRIASVTAALTAVSNHGPVGLGKIVPESARPVDVQTNLVSAHIKYGDPPSSHSHRYHFCFPSMRLM